MPLFRAYERSGGCQPSFLSISIVVNFLTANLMSFGNHELTEMDQGQLTDYAAVIPARTQVLCLTDPYSKLANLLSERASLLVCISRYEEARANGLANPVTAQQYEWANGEAARLIEARQVEVDQIEQQIKQLCKQIGEQR